MKFLKSGGKLYLNAVAPYAGAWIEIEGKSGQDEAVKVAPYAGAWIEIGKHWLHLQRQSESLPTRERGLKS